MNTCSKHTKRRTRQEVQALLSRYQKSGMTVREFSEAEGVAISSIYKWRRRQRSRVRPPDLVELTPAPEMSGHFTVATPQGYRIELPVRFAADDLRRLLSVLES